MILDYTNILSIILRRKPISIVRYGDGEGILLNGFNNEPLLKEFMLRQLGYVPDRQEIEAIRDNLIKALADCNIVGVPDHKNLDSLDAHWRNAEDYFNKYVPGGVFKLRCSINVHYEFLTRDYFNKILLGERIVNYISCRPLDEQLKRKYNIHHINSFRIAPEMKYTRGYEGERHYPDQFNKVQEWMDSIEVENTYCLVGAGVVGKSYCNWFRDRGGIAFDIGSIFDSWAGLATRGPKRGLFAEDLEYKL